MNTYEIRRIRSGFGETFAWLSIRYRAAPEKLNVLHIVVSAPDEVTPLGPIYLERHDQAIASYGGARRILVVGRHIEVHLNRKGVESLSLDRAMKLVAPEALVGWKKAIRVLQVIAGGPSGGVIEMAR